MKKIIAILILFTFVGIISACEPQDGSRVSRFLHTNQTDALRLEEDFETSSFLEDGIGLVELASCNYGHSTNFREVGSVGDSFTTRYFGIRAPRNHTTPPEPWSWDVADYVCGLLSNAERIVLQADPESNRRDTHQRYLVYVWYDNGSGIFRNLNLELIEQAYAAYTGGSSLYNEIFLTAWFDTQATNRRIWGEDDPDPRTGE